MEMEGRMKIWIGMLCPGGQNGLLNLMLKFTKKYWKVLAREVFPGIKNMHTLLCAQSKGLKKV